MARLQQKECRFLARRDAKDRRDASEWLQLLVATMVQGSCAVGSDSSCGNKQGGKEQCGN
ncbi:MAG: hypothetical protein Aurels2KO_52680 [Aureliella sp.]